MSKYKLRFYQWIAQNLEVEWQTGVLVKSVELRVVFKGIVIWTAKVDEYSSKWNVKIIEELTKGTNSYD